jgi:hypothetical protein
MSSTSVCLRVRSYNHPTVMGVRAIMLLLQVHVHLMHKATIVLLTQAASYLVGVLQRRAASGAMSEVLDDNLLNRVSFYKNVSVFNVLTCVRTRERSGLPRACHSS